MKPDWKDAPEWAMWVAMDEDGEWWWYEHKPGTTSGGAGLAFEIAADQRELFQKTNGSTRWKLVHD